MRGQGRIDAATRELYRSLRLIKSGNFTIATERIIDAADSADQSRRLTDLELRQIKAEAWDEGVMHAWGFIPEGKNPHRDNRGQYEQ